jgi:transcriptional regulator with XRE-family HTH domain
MNYLAENLKYLRWKKEDGEGRRRSVKVIANQLGWKRSTLNSYEVGVVEPSLDRLIELADFYGVGLDDLVRKDLSSPLALQTLKGSEIGGCEGCRVRQTMKVLLKVVQESLDNPF